MRIASQVFILISLLLLATGCGSMCITTQDANFHAYGGVRDRQDLVNGRVASLLDPAAALPGVPVIEEPLPPEEKSEDDKQAEDASMDDMLKSDFRNNLLDELEKLDKLPEDLPTEDDDTDPEEIDVI